MKWTIITMSKSEPPQSHVLGTRVALKRRLQEPTYRRDTKAFQSFCRRGEWLDAIKTAAINATGQRLPADFEVGLVQPRPSR